MKRALLTAIRLYQRTVSPGLGAVCRFEPSCSRYAYTAIERYGVLRGSFLTVRRLARCVPWRPGGYDPVPGEPETGVRDAPSVGQRPSAAFSTPAVAGLPRRSRDD